MSTSVEHYQEAERLLREAADAHDAGDDECYSLDAAQVHATLALAAVTALSPASDEGPLADFLAWHKAASVEAPVAPEPDDEELVQEGSMSPGPDDDPDVFAGWLRAVPPGSTLTDNDGDGWYRLVSLDTAANRRRQTLVGAGGGDVQEIGDRVAMAAVQEFAPFTVLALGETEPDQSTEE